MVVDLRELLKKIFALKGVEILDREPYDYIWARDVEGLELIYLEDSVQVDGEYVVSFSRKTEQIHASKTIICLKGCTSNARDMAEKLKIDLLDRREFAHVLGEFLIEIYEQGKLNDLEILKEEDIEVEEFETEQDEDTIPIFLEEVDEEGEERIIKPIVMPEKAEEIARNYIHGFHQELVLLPYFLFEYSLELLIEGTMQTKAVKGVLAINAINGKHDLWKRGYETTTRINLEHRKMEPKVGLDEVKSQVESILEEQYSREEEVKIEGENVTIIEKKKTRPKKGSIKAHFMGLYYLPLWVIEGKRGIITINAATGEIIKEKIY